MFSYVKNGHFFIKKHTPDIRNTHFKKHTKSHQHQAHQGIERFLIFLCDIRTKYILQKIVKMHFLHKFSETQAQQGFQQSDTRNKNPLFWKQKIAENRYFFTFVPIFRMSNICFYNEP